MSQTIAIDMRMVRASGIGTILTNVVPWLISARPEWRFILIGDVDLLSTYDWIVKADNVELVHYDAPIYHPSEYWKWPSSALKSANVVWSPNYNCAFWSRKKLLVSVHDVAHLALPDMFGGIKRVYAKFMFQRARKSADAIGFISEFGRQDFIKHVGPLLCESKVIHCGVNEQWFDVKRADVPAHPRPYFLFVGNVKPHKNLRRLLEAFAKVKGELSHDLVIVGKKDGFITGDEKIEELVPSLEGRVHFSGYLEQADLEQLFKQADALVLPSFYEGFGLPPVEAMAVGCPAAVSNVASMPEVCQDAALYFDPFDVDDIAAALKKIATDDALRDELRRKGAVRARELSWQAMREAYLDMIEKLL